MITGYKNAQTNEAGISCKKKQQYSLYTKRHIRNMGFQENKKSILHVNEVNFEF